MFGAGKPEIELDLGILGVVLWVFCLFSFLSFFYQLFGVHGKCITLGGVLFLVCFIRNINLDFSQSEILLRTSYRLSVLCSSC